MQVLLSTQQIVSFISISLSYQCGILPFLTSNIPPCNRYLHMQLANINRNISGPLLYVPRHTLLQLLYNINTVKLLCRTVKGFLLCTQRQPILNMWRGRCVRLLATRIFGQHSFVRIGNATGNRPTIFPTSSMWILFGEPTVVCASFRVPLLFTVALFCSSQYIYEPQSIKSIL